jgi:hypothetical protein
MTELIIEQPAGSAMYMPPTLIDVELPGMTVLKLINVVVDESALSHVLVNHHKTLNVVELDSVSLVMTDHTSESLASRTFHWTNIMGYLRIMNLSKVHLSSFSWRDEEGDLITNKYLETGRIKLHGRWVILDHRQYWKLSNRNSRASGSRWVKTG